MPSAGRMRPNTMSSGILTTPRHSPVNTITLSATLVKRPKKPFQSPGTHQLGSAFVAVIVMCCPPSPTGAERGDDRLRAADPAKNPALRLDHFEAHFLEFREIRA